MRNHTSYITKFIIGLFPIVAIIFFILGCQKQTLKESCVQKNKYSHYGFRNDSAHSLRLWINTLNDDSQRTVFQSLSASYKALVWIDKFESVYDFAWSAAQLTLLQEMEGYITDDLFTANSNERAHFKSTICPDWISGTTGVFTNDQLNYIVGSLMDYEERQNAGPGDTDCECSQYSDWCWGSSCEGRCNDTPSDWGCGTLWSWGCDSLCE